MCVQTVNEHLNLFSCQVCFVYLSSNYHQINTNSHTYFHWFEAIVQKEETDNNSNFHVIIRSDLFYANALRLYKWL